MKRSSITRSSQSVTLTLVMGGKEENPSVSSPYGPVRAGLTTLRGTNEDQALTELLNSLERQVEILQSKSCTVLDTFLNGTTHLVEPTLSTVSEIGTDI